MLETLQGYYRERGILSTSFTCKHKSQCANGCSDFTGPKSAFVSSGYELGRLPRLLFVSLDSGSGDKVDDNRLPSAVRQHEEWFRSFENLAKHKHWYRTHELAWYILQRFDQSLKIEQARRFFAHANSAKCCMNKAQRKKANAVLFRNCKEYLGGELAILRPAVVVTQGKEARDAVGALCQRQVSRFDEFASTVDIVSRTVFWLHTYHPNNWGAFNRQRSIDKETGVARGWTKYAELIHQFVTSGKPSAS